MTLISANGISSRRFAAWMDQQDMNAFKQNKDKVARYNSKTNSFYGRQKNVHSSNL